MNVVYSYQVFIILLLWLPVSCRQQHDVPSKESINELQLKRGELISCGPANKQFGKVIFETSCVGKAKEDFNLAMTLLHSFEYDEAEKVFAKIIDEQPGCVMAYWGVAMSNFHPLWTPPTEPELIKGVKAVDIAKSITQKTKREEAYIEAIAAYYVNWDKTDHRTRCLNFERNMEKLYTTYPDDKEAAIFYALALNAAADPADQTFVKQKKAGTILNALYPEEPNHPGIIHYIIHTYDYPALATLALPAARKYAAVAPSSAHALHMPSHIFTRVGLWDECIQSNLTSVSAAQCYAKTAGINGHWDEELHGLDYLMYAYLQKRENNLAKKQLDYLKTIKKVSPANFKVAYAFAAIPARYVLENKLWKEAANLQIPEANFSWDTFLWQQAIIHYTRLLGAVHTGNKDIARAAFKDLKRIHESLTNQKDAYKANQVEIQVRTGEAWMRLAEGKNAEALMLMKTAADMEDRTEKHPVTPGEVLPARELLGDMYMQMNKWNEALEAYEADLEKHPNRFNGLYGAGLAAQKLGNKEKASLYFQQLSAFADTAQFNRGEINYVRQVSNKQ